MTDRTEKHFAWRKRVARNLPEWAARTFALRNKSYLGCGFHYGLEKQLGSVIRLTNDYEGDISAAGAVIDRVIVEAFVSALGRAEASAAESTEVSAA